ncbi:MAG: acylphosphatase [Candidatus Diapherotrites archaeon]|nr:acylphosphatase [Candidatus Diapherotrites archaeon]
MNQNAFLVSFFGRVQGVGLRILVLEEANKRGIKGWVRNSDKHDLVEALFLGEKKIIMELIGFLESKERHGFVRVDRVVINEMKTEEEVNGFEIRY